MPRAIPLRIASIIPAPAKPPAAAVPLKAPSITCTTSSRARAGTAAPRAVGSLPAPLSRAAIAEKFLKEGFDVTGFDRKEASISQDSYTHFCLDIRDREQYPALAPFDIVINNAGVQNENDIDINLKGTIAITEAYGIHDTIRAVLMIGSASGHTGAEFPEYTASKGGVLAYTKNVALRIAPYGGTCNSLDFGGVLTS